MPKALKKSLHELSSDLTHLSPHKYCKKPSTVIFKLLGSCLFISRDTSKEQISWTSREFHIISINISKVLIKTVFVSLRTITQLTTPLNFIQSMPLFRKALYPDCFDGWTPYASICYSSEPWSSELEGTACLLDSS